MECTLHLPAQSGVDDLDLCIILANAVDNAARACTYVTERRPYVRITGRQQGKLLLLEVENSRPARTVAGRSGLGLYNIQAAADKYHGAVRTEQGPGWFRTSILLCISYP